MSGEEETLRNLSLCPGLKGKPFTTADAAAIDWAVVEIDHLRRENERLHQRLYDARCTIKQNDPTEMGR